MQQKNTNDTLIFNSIKKKKKKNNFYLIMKIYIIFLLVIQTGKQIKLCLIIENIKLYQMN